MMQRLFSIFKTDKDDGPEKQRTEPMRASVFEGSDQEKWQRYSLEAESRISKMYKQGASLHDIYEYARNKRQEIAVKLDHIPVEQFGRIRNSEDYGREQSDIYKIDSIAGGKTNNTSIYIKITELVVSQLADSFSLHKVHKKDFHQNESMLWVLASEENPVYEYRSKSDYPVTSRVEIYSPDNLNQPGNHRSPDMIKVRWQRMNEDIYKVRLAELNKPFQEWKKTEDKEALYQLGLLAHDLARETFLTRGTAAVTGWILRGMAQTKDIKLGNLRVAGLPFDIYAQLQPDRHKYAIEFMNSVIESFNLERGSQKRQTL